MENQEMKNEQVNQEQQAQPAPAQKQEQQAQTTEQQKTEPKKDSFFKRHKKGIAIGGTGVVAAIISAVAAYKRGKAAGIASVPVPPQEDYSLNPNIE